MTLNPKSILKIKMIYSSTKLSKKKNNNNNNSPRSYKGVLSSLEPPAHWHPPFSSLPVPLQPATPTDTTLTVKHTSHQ